MRVVVFALLLFEALIAAGFDWYGYKEGLALAKEKNRPVMIMISQPDCNMCEYMDDVAFENEELVDFVENNYIPVKLDVAEARRLGYKAYGTPTFYFLDSTGKRITRPIAGAAPAKRFLEKLKEIKRGL